MKKILIVLLVLTTSFVAYVLLINRNSKNMSPRQKLLKAVYPVMIWFTKATGTHTLSLSSTAITPVVPFYTLPAIGNDGKPLNLSDFSGKKILLVNTASDCGYTGQYDALEQL